MELFEDVRFSTFKDCLARRILVHPDFLPDSGTPGSQAGGQADSDPLDDFTTYLAVEIWPSLPQCFHEASYETRDVVPDLDDLSFDTISLSFTESLISYGLVEDVDSAFTFLRRTLRDYIAQACAPPPVWSRTRTTECEICEREVPLTYHHLIPREVHDKVLKKKWHPSVMLNSVAWLCRCARHTYVPVCVTHAVDVPAGYTQAVS